MAERTIRLVFKIMIFIHGKFGVELCWKASGKHGAVIGES